MQNALEHFDFQQGIDGINTDQQKTCNLLLGFSSEAGLFSRILVAAGHLLSTPTFPIEGSACQRSKQGETGLFSYAVAPS